MIIRPGLEPFIEHYAALPKAPLRITAVLEDSVINPDSLHLDAILSYAVVALATDGAGLNTEKNSTEPYCLPLPLACLWVGFYGLPLWASTDFVPAGAHVEDTKYYHKRMLESHMATSNIRIGRGVHKELRTAYKTSNAIRMSADCIGNIDAITELLQLVPAIGKKHGTSGSVAEWRIEHIESFSLFDARGRAQRPIPCNAVSAPHFDAQHVGFTPPYWLQSAFDMCYVTGMELPELAQLNATALVQSV